MTPAKVLSREIEHYVHCNFMVMTEPQMEATRNAWLSCQLADHPANAGELCQRLHRQDLQKMHDAFAVRD